MSCKTIYGKVTAENKHVHTSHEFGEKRYPLGSLKGSKIKLSSDQKSDEKRTVNN